MKNRTHYCASRASSFLTQWSPKLNPDLEFVDWHCFLRENRRSPYSPSAISAGAVRGNTHIFGQIRHAAVNKAAVYARCDLIDFLLRLKRTPAHIEWLARNAKKFGE
jgi:hypothetical protein